MSDKLRIFESDRLNVDIVGGPAGTFTLSMPPNGGYCPVCERRVPRLWLFTPASNSNRSIVVACDVCVPA